MTIADQFLWIDCTDWGLGCQSCWPDARVALPILLRMARRASRIWWISNCR